jgi:hypothetical protein
MYGLSANVAEKISKHGQRDIKAIENSSCEAETPGFDVGITHGMVVSGRGQK